MMTKPSRKALRALYSFSQHTGWDDVSDFFNEELLKTYEAMAGHFDEVKLRQFQGRAQFIREFLDLVRDAHQNLEKLRDSGL